MRASFVNRLTDDALQSALRASKEAAIASAIQQGYKPASLLEAAARPTC
jgi:hypothetical protein